MRFDIKAFEPITKGWSGDKKFYMHTSAGQKMFLRISYMSECDRKKSEHEIMGRMYEIGVPVAKPIEFGVCRDGKNVFFLSEWLDGKDAESMLPLMAEAAQYELGKKAGEALRKIHSLSITNVKTDWHERYFAIIDERIDAYRSKGVPFKGSETVLAYLEQNRGLLHNRPQSLLHGDFHEGNLMIDDGRLYIIDLLDEGFGNCGDPWYDFRAFSSNNNAYFFTGMVRGYFYGEAPKEFWDVLTYYLVTATLTAIVWMKYHRPDELPKVLKQNEDNAMFLRDGRSPLVKWYLKDL